MHLLCLLALMSILISTALMLGATLLGKKTQKDMEKLSPFECGFSPMNKNTTPFSLQFFLIALVFLIFEVEVALILPLGGSLNPQGPLTSNFTGLALVLILTLGLIHEWIAGALSWIK